MIEPDAPGGRDLNGRAQKPPLSSSLLLSAAMLCGCEASRLDQQMEKLCRTDGGVKVYETVTLPKSRFDDTGRLITGERQIQYRRTLIPVGREYLIERRNDVIKDGNPFAGGALGGALTEGRLVRYIATVRRISDDKVMGIEITYGRTGGDFTLGHPSQNFCPKPRPNPDVEHGVFIRGD